MATTPGESAETNALAHPTVPVAGPRDDTSGWTFAQLLAAAPGPLATTDWTTVDTEQLAEFARASRLTAADVDVTLSKRNRWGQTLVDGFLLVSLLVHFEWASIRILDEHAWALNYGLDRVRFIAPLFAGERVRDHITLLDAQQRTSAGQVLLRTRHELEIEHQTRPAMVADWLTLLLTDDLEVVR